MDFWILGFVFMGLWSYEFLSFILVFLLWFLGYWVLFSYGLWAYDVSSLRIFGLWFYRF